MKVLILAGGRGSRLSEETILKPKPMIEIGNRPILWHIMKGYSHYGFNDFIILTGYKSHLIKNYFVNYYQEYSDLTVDLSTNTVTVHKTRQEPWKVTLLYTGQNTMTGSRIKKAKNYIGDERFLLTYGDGVSDVNISDLIRSHESSGKLATVTVVKPSGRFGAVTVDKNSTVSAFMEKPKGDGGWINGGFFVCEPQVLDYIGEGENVIFEQGPLENLAKNGQLHAFKHDGFWQP
ncbi:MAG: glucose-1-phosphate cytidylyltransferase, partial [Elusimicrobiaceae bacterium]|nr:glucose-1-phosphate cytidylyltransferase [Elusimicrobiaceae bacterium]